MSLTAAVYDANGATIPDAYTLRLDAEIDLKSVLGNGLNLDSTAIETDATPQGMIMVTKVASRMELLSAVLWLLAQIDIDTSEGVYQDSNGKLFGITRIPSRKTLVNVVCSGLTGITIPANSTVQDINGNIYESQISGVIPASGQVVIDFYAQEDGEINCPAGAITTIFSRVGGWDSATNIEDGIIGRPEETQQEFAARMRLSVERNSGGTLGAMIGRLLDLAGVTDVFARANFTTEPLVLTGVTIPVHYSYIAVVGGTDQAVIDVLGSASCGCGFIGNTTGYHDDGGILYPVAFERPADIDIYFKISAKAGAYQPIDSIKQAVLDTFNGLVTGIDRAKIGADILASDYYYNIKDVRVLDIGVGLSASPTGTVVNVPANRVPKLTLARIEVVYV